MTTVTTDHVRYGEIVEARFQREMRRGAALIAVVVLYGLELPKLLGNWTTSYQSQAVQLAAVAVLTFVPAIAWQDTVVKRWRWPLIALVLAASIAATITVVPADRLGTPHWSDEAVGWSLILLAMDRTLPLFLGLLAAHYVPAFALALFDGPVKVTFAGVVNSTAITASFQVAVVLFANALRRVGTSVARMGREEERTRTLAAVSSQLHEDRKNRYAALAGTTAPLLAGLGSGELNPGDESVRRSCAIEAARMRRLFGDAGERPDPLVDELTACVGLAERNGVSVRFSAQGESRAIPTEVRRMLTEPAVAVLATARGKVRLTVVGAPDQVTVSVVAAAGEYDVPEVEHEEITTSTIRTDGRLWIEATWKGQS
ncbi:hypothetical protein [Actinocrispum sp. NPDC049592]|uniref:hypothetical protein n=1 Tax=Actinocrispum sp. NPDC049592 TaxID=3154835 RepID=UPI003448AF21